MTFGVRLFTSDVQYRNGLRWIACCERHGHNRPAHSHGAADRYRDGEREAAETVSSSTNQQRAAAAAAAARQRCWTDCRININMASSSSSLSACVRHDECRTTVRHDVTGTPVWRHGVIIHEMDRYVDRCPTSLNVVYCL